MNTIKKWALKKYEQMLERRMDRIIQSAKTSKASAMQAIEGLRKIYVLEDNKGREYTYERLLDMSHEELIEILEHYNKEMKKEYGEV